MADSGQTMGWTDEDLEELHRMAQLEDAQHAMAFINALRKASLDDVHSQLPPEAIDRIRNPPRELPDTTDPDLLLSLKYYFADMTIKAYNTVRDATMERHPEDDIYSYYSVKQAVSELSGVVPIIHDMCINTCLAFTGPYSDLDNCPRCGEDRWDTKKSKPDKKVARRTFDTFPIGPQLQALWRHPDQANKMRWREEYTKKIFDELKTSGGIPDVYEDVLYGKQYLDACQSGRIKEGDAVLMFSIDGAQLYESKQSDCWIYIWVVFDHAPDERYKKKYVLPGGIIPGPKKPKNLDSFIFPGLHHLRAIQTEGLPIWDGAKKSLFRSNPFLFVATADGPGMAFLTGLVGHHGRFACRLYCGLPGRHKPGAPTYYPALRQPDGPNPLDHPDFFIHQLPLPGSFDYERNLERVIRCTNMTEYELARLETGITKPSIFCGFDTDHILLVPLCFGSDIMHIAAINVGDLLLPLWRGTFRAEATDDKSTWDWAVLTKAAWKAHGSLIADATPFLPGSFDRPPRNPAEKINSGYKAWEWLLYLYGMAPATLYGILPQPYWTNFCHLARGLRLMQQYHISRSDLVDGHHHLLDFADEFEELYYQRRIDRLHFIRPWLHSITHIAGETVNKGPPICSSQWTMERTIGNLAQEIRLHNSSVYANLSQRAARRCQINAIKAIIPTIEPSTNALPKGSLDLGQGYILLRRRERSAHIVRPCEADAILRYLSTNGIDIVSAPSVTRWARLRLPNGQVARSAWKENAMSRHPRIARNVKVSFFLSI
jgi:hypothetical protein